MNYGNLTERQQDVVDAVPGTYPELADRLSISVPRTRGIVSQIISRGYNLKRDPIGDNGRIVVYDAHNDNDARTHYDVPGERISKATVTRRYNDALTEIQAWLAQDLNADPAPCPEFSVRPSAEDVVIHRSDAHIGAKYRDENGNYHYDTDTAIEREGTVTDRVDNLCLRQEKAGVEFDTAHLLLGGDMIHGEGIYPDQPWETEIPLVKQIEVASDLYMEQIDRLRHRFPQVQVVMQNGNHGELRGDGMGPTSNADDIVYMTLRQRVRDRGYENVRTIHKPHASYYTNFTMREGEWNGHLRHGQKSLFHIGTSSGKDRWKTWLIRHAFDIAYRGHYHELRLENVLSYPVIMSGAACPPDDFEEGLGEWSEPAATIHGVSDERVLTWFYPVDFTG